MISQQSGDETELGVHPALLKPAGLGHQQTHGHRHRDHHARGGDDVRQTALHQAVLLAERSLQLRGELFGFSVVNEQPNQIEEACKPNDDTNDVECLEPEIGLRWQSHECTTRQPTIRRVQPSPSRNCEALA